MTTIHDDQLYEHASRLKDSVVLITGAANGIGRTAAFEFAKHGAKVVAGDLDQASGIAVVEKIVAEGGQATFLQTDVLDYESLVSLFQHTIRTYGKLDVVVPCAGITEHTATTVGVINLDENGVPKRPSLKTAEVNLLAVMNTTHLALHYLTLDQKSQSTPIPLDDLDPSSVPPPNPKEQLKSIVLIGSIASIQGIPSAPNYSAAKHGIIGFMGGIRMACRLKNVHIGTVCPWFADTAIVPITAKVLLAGIPKAPIPRIAGAIIRCATEPDWLASAALWTILDDGPVFRIEKVVLNEGVYKLLNNRLLVLGRLGNNLKYTVATILEIFSLLHNRIVLAVFGLALGILIRKYTT